MLPATIDFDRHHSSPWPFAANTWATPAKNALMRSGGQPAISVMHLARLESRLPMVARNYFRDLLPGDHEQREAAIVRALQQGIVIPYELPNPKMPGRTMLAIKLNQDHPTVKAILSATKPSAPAIPAVKGRRDAMKASLG